MKTTIVVLFSLLLVACASAGPEAGVSSTPPSPSNVVPPPAPPASSSPSPRHPVEITAPSELRGSPRYVPDGVLVHDTITSKTWYASDLAGWYDGFDATAECAGFAPGFRPPTSAEIEALGGPLPEAFHAVYAWASHANLSFFPDNARPIVTSDGCVDVRTASAFSGDCVIPGIPHVSRSTMCVHD